MAAYNAPIGYNAPKYYNGSDGSSAARDTHDGGFDHYSKRKLKAYRKHLEMLARNGTPISPDTIKLPTKATITKKVINKTKQIPPEIIADPDDDIVLLMLAAILA